MVIDYYITSYLNQNKRRGAIKRTF